MGVTSSDYALHPRLRLKDGRIITTLDEAVAFLVGMPGPPIGRREGVLRRLEGAHGDESKRDAALAFQAWLEQEGLLDRPVD